MKFTPSYTVNYQGTCMYPGKKYEISPDDAKVLKGYGAVEETAPAAPVIDDDDLGLGEEKPKATRGRNRK